MQERGGKMGRRGKESHRQRSSELLLIVNEIKGLKGLREIEVGAAGATGGGRGAYATAQLSAAVIGPGVPDIREMRDIPDEGVSFSKSQFTCDSGCIITA